jgi:hypothetical protein
MTYTFKLSRRLARLRVPALALMLGAAFGCGSTDNLSPSSDAPASDPDASAPTSLDTGTLKPGIGFGSFGLDNTLLGTTQNVTVRQPGPKDILWLLSGARARGARVIVKLSGADRYYLNSDGTFNLSKWKTMVDRFKSVDFSSYVADGTLMAHYLVDEPNDASNWGGKAIPQATIEAMAAYSKQLWPSMTTIVRVVPSWLNNTGTHFVALDAAWAQYAGWKGDINTWMTREVTAAKGSGLSLVMGLNVLDGGTSSSGIPGRKAGSYAMSASQLKSWGTTLVSQPSVCGFVMWTYSSTYYDRSDIKTAMADLSSQARAHATVSCSGGTVSSPTAPAPAPDTTSAPAVTGTGVPYGPYDLPAGAMASFTGAVRAAGRPVDVMPVLAAARLAGTRVVLRLAPGDKKLKNADGTFNLAAWKAAVDAFASVDLASYVNDGTIAGHLMVESPHRSANWGGKGISYATLDEMARYSRLRWSAMPTLVHAPPSWLSSNPTAWQYLDAASTVYYGTSGDAATWIGRQVTDAGRGRLGLFVGMNVLNGGTSSSGIPGTSAGRYAMSASQLQNWGSALLNRSEVCGLSMWRYNTTYFGRSDIRSAVATLKDKARAHAARSCRVR